MKRNEYEESSVYSPVLVQSQSSNISLLRLTHTHNKHDDDDDDEKHILSEKPLFGFLSRDKVQCHRLRRKFKNQRQEEV